MNSDEGDIIAWLWNAKLYFESCIKFGDIFCFSFLLRDLKPANVMFADDNSPIIMDLGSAARARVEIRTMQEARVLQVSLDHPAV